MEKNPPMMKYRKINFTIVSASLATFFACALCVWWIVMQADSVMREELLKQAELVATTIDSKRCLRLTGTIDDLTKEDYLNLRIHYKIT